MRYLTIVLFFIIIIPSMASAAEQVDSDLDGLSDELELSRYFTNPEKADTDGDGYTDGEEVTHSYSPTHPDKFAKMKMCDLDKDGLNDELELAFGTILNNPDTDGDGYTDGEEVKKGFDPKNADKNVKLVKKIEVNLKQQKVSYFLGSVNMGSYIISSGKPGMETPKGEYKIINKHPKAWSKAYGLWMPYWMGIKDGRFGFHELPEWPNGYKEGQDHLGKPVSHGCIRLGVGDAKKFYDWTEINTTVKIY